MAKGNFQVNPGDRRRTRGQALVEMAVVVVLLVLLAAGVIEFGRAFMIANMITHAAREGARFAATLPDTYRDDGGCYTEAGKTLVKNHVQAMIQTVMDTNGQFEVAINQSGLDGPVPTVTLRITGSVDYVALVGMLGDGFAVDRTMTFRDEGREEGAAC